MKKIVNSKYISFEEYNYLLLIQKPKIQKIKRYLSISDWLNNIILK